MLYAMKGELVSKMKGQEDRQAERHSQLFKTRDEELTNKEIEKEMRNERKVIKTEYGGNTRRTRSIMRKLNNEAHETRLETREKYRDKIKILKRKHLIDEEEKISRAPPELKHYAPANIFMHL